MTADQNIPTTSDHDKDSKRPVARLGPWCEGPDGWVPKSPNHNDEAPQSPQSPIWDVEHSNSSNQRCQPAIAVSSQTRKNGHPPRTHDYRALVQELQSIHEFQQIIGYNAKMAENRIFALDAILRPILLGEHAGNASDQISDFFWESKVQPKAAASQFSETTGIGSDKVGARRAPSAPQEFKCSENVALAFSNVVEIPRFSSKDSTMSSKDSTSDSVEPDSPMTKFLKQRRRSRKMSGESLNLDKKQQKALSSCPWDPENNTRTSKDSTSVEPDTAMTKFLKQRRRRRSGEGLKLTEEQQKALSSDHLDQESTKRTSKDLTPVEPPSPQLLRAQRSKTQVLAKLELSRSNLISAYRQRIWVFMEEPTSSTTAFAYACLSPILVLLGVTVAFLSTVDHFSSLLEVLSGLDLFVDCFFASELLLRLGVCPNRVSFVRDWYNIIDILCILPIPFKVLTSFSLPGDTSTTENTILHVAVLCAVPAMRLLKTTRHYWGFRILVKSLKKASEALPVPSYLLLVIMVTFSSILFLVEPRSNLSSMSDALWFVLVTVSTVGYGDLSPETQAGRFISGVLIVVGVLYTAMPVQIVGDAFAGIWRDRDKIFLVEKTRDKLEQWGYSHEDVEVFFEHFDQNGDGELGLDEFRTMMHEIQPGTPDARVIQLFQTLDVDGGGSISCLEFLKVVYPEWVAYAAADPGSPMA